MCECVDYLIVVSVDGLVELLVIVVVEVDDVSYCGWIVEWFGWMLFGSSSVVDSLVMFGVFDLFN